MTDNFEKAMKEELLRQPPPLETQIPEQYAILKKVSDGGMGSIYKAQNRYTEKYYAIKVLLPEYADDAEFRQRFIIEAKAASALKHPNICQVHDFGVTANRSLYLAMDWIDGISLQHKIEADGPMAASKALIIYQQIASALVEAQRLNILHRDLKPDNIMLTGTYSPSGNIHAYLVDFGLAKSIGVDMETQGLTTVGTVVGTPTYMSPEQARATPLDGRSDIYSLGCVMYLALTATLPFRGDTAMDTMFMHINDAPPEMEPKLKIPADLRSVVLKSMEKEPSNRYQNAEQLLDELSKIARGESIEKVSLSSDGQKQRQKKLNIALFVLGFVIMYFASTFLQTVLDKVFPDKNSKATTQDHPAASK
jgi:serine/threonine-protein kinase